MRDSEERGFTSQPRQTPGFCLRGTETCAPMHAIVSDDGATFVCCGRQHDGESHDPYRMCFKSQTTDTIYDHDELDLLDIIEVATRALSTVKRFTECEGG